MLSESIKKSIVESLKVVKPYKVVLFGSYAYGNPGKDSDLDLYVVTKKDFVPQNYRENMEHYLSVSKKLRPLKNKFPVDLIVHTLPMHKKFVELGSSFSREIMKNGIVLYETDND